MAESKNKSNESAENEGALTFCGVRTIRPNADLKSVICYAICGDLSDRSRRGIGSCQK